MKKLIMLLIAIFLILSITACVTPKVSVVVESKVLLFPVAPVFPVINFVTDQTGGHLSFDDGRKLAKFIVDYKAFYKKYQESINYNMPESLKK